MCNMYSILQKLCAQKGITITEMCRAAGVPRSSVGNLATGSTQQLSAKNMQKLATYFNVSADVYKRQVSCGFNRAIDALKQCQVHHRFCNACHGVKHPRKRKFTILLKSIPGFHANK